MLRDNGDLTYPGNVGIGTPTPGPGYKLDVAGTINATAITIGGYPVATSKDTYWSIVGAGPDIQYSGGKVGVNTAVPAYTLDVGGDLNVAGSILIDGVPLSGTGTVTSVTGSGGSTGLTVTGGPVTTAGTLTLGGTLALTSGGTGATTAAAARTNLGLGTAATLAATNANTASTVVGRDPSGNFSAGTITATLTGTASKATGLVGGNSTTLYGAMPYQSGIDATTWVSPNTTTTKKFLRMTGSGSNGAIPAWDTVVAADIPTLNQNSTGTAANITGTVAVANGGTGTATGSITGTGALTLAAGGTNQNVLLTPTGAGYSMLGGNVAIGGTAAATTKLNIVDTSSTVTKGLNIVKSGAVSGNVFGAYMEASGATGWNEGACAVASGTGTSNVGIQASANGASTGVNFGVYATASGGTAQNTGILGSASGSTGTSSYGGYFESAATITTAKYGVYARAVGNSTGANYGGYFTATNTGAAYALVTEAGNVGIGTLTPTSKLDVAGDVNITGSYRVNGTAINSGTVTSVTGTAPISVTTGTTTPVVALTGTVPVANGGTGATTAALARTALSAAGTGANGDITSLTGLTTDLSVAQGGTGASTLTGYVKGSGTAAMTASATIPGSVISGNITGSAANVTGTVAVANGGTGKTTETSYPGGYVLYGEGNSTPGVSGNLVWDRTNNRLGVKDSSPSYTVDVTGDVNITGAFRVNGTAVATTLDYAMAAKTTTTSLASSGTDVGGWGTPYLRGAITQNGSTYFVLKAGKTYELECALKIYNYSVSGAVYYSWANDSNTAVGNVNVSAYVYPTTHTASEANQPVAKAVFTPSVDTNVKVRLTSVPGTVTVEYAGSYVTIKQLQ